MATTYGGMEASDARKLTSLEAESRSALTEADMKVDGHCLCGVLRYQASVDPETVLICNCTDCQTLAGSAFRLSVSVDDGSFRILSGTPATYIKIADSGRRRELGFCPRCGTSVYSRPPDGEPGYFGLRVGSLRQRDVLVPRAQFWHQSAQRWIDKIDEIPAFEGD
jgi:hypothetical protein